MNSSERGGLAGSLDAIYKAERSLRELNRKVERSAKAVDAIEKAVKEARGQKSEEERALRLVCLVRILRAIKEPKALDILIDVLGDDSEEAQASAGIALEDIAFDRMGALDAAIERAVKTLPPDHHALHELPFVILNVSEGDAKRRLLPFLGLKDSEAVACAIEALVENADPTAMAHLEPLRTDTRIIEIEDESTGESAQVTIADLVKDAMDALDEVRKATSEVGA